ncbi:MAG: hypothetical protein OXT67_06470 [Zetaproteobacteria bacterium]|nr:hypothetical protein [Zetaproteobacteria bacterium]
MAHRLSPPTMLPPPAVEHPPEPALEFALGLRDTLDVDAAVVEGETELNLEHFLALEPTVTAADTCAASTSLDVGDALLSLSELEVAEFAAPSLEWVNIWGSDDEIR